MTKTPAVSNLENSNFDIVWDLGFSILDLLLQGGA